MARVSTTGIGTRDSAIGTVASGVAGLPAQHGEQLADTVVVDVPDPVDVETPDSLPVPSDVRTTHS